MIKRRLSKRQKAIIEEKKRNRPLLNPAQLVARRFGGVWVASSRLGYTSATVVRKWIERGGEIRDKKRVLEKAKELGIEFTAEECIHGGYE